MVVTLCLGYTYLWVDRYCINQHEDMPRQHQIDQMDIIYSRAEVTIVAAAGDGGNDGLPGLSRKAPPSRPMVEVGDVILTPFSQQSRRRNKSIKVELSWLDLLRIPALQPLPRLHRRAYFLDLLNHVLLEGSRMPWQCHS